MRRDGTDPFLTGRAQDRRAFLEKLSELQRKEKRAIPECLPAWNPKLLSSKESKQRM